MSVTQVQTSGISDDGVTNSKIADNAIGTAEIADNAVTGSKIALNVIGNDKIIDSAVSASKLNGGQSGPAPVFGVRAWGRVDRDGNLTYGGNVSGATRTATGQYTVFIPTNMNNNNYAVVITIDSDPGSGSGGGSCAYITSKSSNSFSIIIRESDAGQTGGLQSRNDDFNFIVIG